jgi:hypothetical protein
VKSRYRHETPLDLYAPLPVELRTKPVEVVGPPANSCRCNKVDCMECWDAGVRYADYRKQKRLEKL